METRNPGPLVMTLAQHEIQDGRSGRKVRRDKRQQLNSFRSLQGTHDNRYYSHVKRHHSSFSAAYPPIQPNTRINVLRRRRDLHTMPCPDLGKGCGPARSGGAGAWTMNLDPNLHWPVSTAQEARNEPVGARQQRPLQPVKVSNCLWQVEFLSSSFAPQDPRGGYVQVNDPKDTSIKLQRRICNDNESVNKLSLSGSLVPTCPI